MLPLPAEPIEVEIELVVFGEFNIEILLGNVHVYPVLGILYVSQLP